MTGPPGETFMTGPPGETFMTGPPNGTSVTSHNSTSVTTGNSHRTSADNSSLELFFKNNSQISDDHPTMSNLNLSLQSDKSPLAIANATPSMSKILKTISSMLANMNVPSSLKSQIFKFFTNPDNSQLISKLSDTVYNLSFLIFPVLGLSASLIVGIYIGKQRLQNVQILENLNSQKDTVIAELRTINRVATSNYEQLQQEKNKISATVLILEQKSTELNHKLDAFANSEQKLQGEIRKFHETVEFLKNENKHIVAFEEKIETLNAQILEKQQGLLDNQEELNNLRGEIEQLRRNLGALEKKSSSEQTDQQRHVATLQLEIQATNRIVDERNASLEQLNKKIGKVELNYRNALRDLTGAREQLQQVNQEKDAKQREIGELQKQLEQLQSKNHTSNGEIERIKAEVDHQKAEYLQTLEKKEAEHQQQIQNLQTQLHSERVTLEKLQTSEGRIQQLEGELVKLTKEYQKYQQEKGAIITELETFQSARDGTLEEQKQRLKELEPAHSRLVGVHKSQQENYAALVQTNQQISAQLQRAENIIQSKLDEIGQLSQKIKEQTGDILELERNLQITSNLLDSATQQKNQLVAEFQLQSQQQQQRVAALELANALSQARISKLDDVHRQTSTDLESKNETIRGQQKRISEIQLELEKRPEPPKDKRQAVDTPNIEGKLAELKELQNQIAKAQEEIQSLRQNLQENIAKKNAAELELRESTAELQQQNEKFDGEKANFRSAIGKLQQQNQSLQLSIESQLQTYQQLQEKNQREITMKQNEVESQRQKLSESQSVVESQRQELEKSQSVVESQRQKLEKSQSVAESQRQKLSESQSVVESQRQKLEKSQSVVESQRQKLESKQSEIDGIKAEHQRILQSNSQEHDRKILILQKQLDALEQTTEQTNQQIRLLSEQLETVKNQNSQFERRVADLTAKAKSDEAQILKLSEQLAAATRDAQLVKDQKEELQSQLQEFLKPATVAKRSRVDVEAENEQSRLREELAKKKEEIQRLSQKYDSEQQQIVNLLKHQLSTQAHFLATMGVAVSSNISETDGDILKLFSNLSDTLDKSRLVTKQLSSDFQAKVSEMQKLQSENSGVLSQLHQAQSSLESMNQVVEHLRVNMALKEQSITDLENKKIDFERRLGELRQLRDDGNKEKTELLSQMESKLSDVNSQLLVHKQSLQSSEERLAQHADLMLQKESEIGALQEENQRVSKSCHDLEQQLLSQSQEQIVNLELQKTSIESTLLERFVAEKDKALGELRQSMLGQFDVSKTQLEKTHNEEKEMLKNQYESKMAALAERLRVENARAISELTERLQTEKEDALSQLRATLETTSQQSLQTLEHDLQIKNASAEKALRAQLEAENARAQEALGVRLEAKNAGAQEALRTQLEAENARAQKALRAQLEAENKEAQKALRAQLEAENASAQEALGAQFYDENARAMAELTERLQTENEEALNQQKEQLGVKNQQSHEALEARLQSEREMALEQQREQLKETNQQSHEALEARLNEKHRQQIAELEQNLNVEIELKLNQQREQSKAEQEVALSQQKEEHGVALRQLKEKHEVALSQLKEKHEVALSQLKKEHEVASSQLKKEHEVALSQLNAEYIEANGTAMKQFNEQKKNEIGQIEKRLHQENSTNIEQIKALKSKLEISVKEIENLKKSNSADLQKLEELKKVHNENSSLRAQNNELASHLSASRDNCQQLSSQLTNLQSQFEANIGQNVGLQQLVSTIKGQNMQLEGLKPQFEKTYSELSEKNGNLQKSIQDLQEHNQNLIFVKNQSYIEMTANIQHTYIDNPHIIFEILEKIQEETKTRGAEFLPREDVQKLIFGNFLGKSISPEYKEAYQDYASKKDGLLDIFIQRINLMMGMMSSIERLKNIFSEKFLSNVARVVVLKENPEDTLIQLTSSYVQNDNIDSFALFQDAIFELMNPQNSPGDRNNLRQLWNYLLTKAKFQSQFMASSILQNMKKVIQEGSVLCKFYALSPPEVETTTTSIRKIMMKWLNFSSESEMSVWIAQLTYPKFSKQLLWNEIDLSGTFQIRQLDTFIGQIVKHGGEFLKFYLKQCLGEAPNFKKWCFQQSRIFDFYIFLLKTNIADWIRSPEAQHEIMKTLFLNISIGNMTDLQKMISVEMVMGVISTIFINQYMETHESTQFTGEELYNQEELMQNYKLMFTQRVAENNVSAVSAQSRRTTVSSAAVAAFAADDNRDQIVEHAVLETRQKYIDNYIIHFEYLYRNFMNIFSTSSMFLNIALLATLYRMKKEYPQQKANPDQWVEMLKHVIHKFIIWLTIFYYILKNSAFRVEVNQRRGDLCIQESEERKMMPESAPQTVGIQFRPVSFTPSLPSSSLTRKSRQASQSSSLSLSLSPDRQSLKRRSDDISRPDHRRDMRHSSPVVTKSKKFKEEEEEQISMLRDTSLGTLFEYLTSDNSLFDKNIGCNETLRSLLPFIEIYFTKIQNTATFWEFSKNCIWQITQQHVVGIRQITELVQNIGAVIDLPADLQSVLFKK